MVAYRPYALGVLLSKLWSNLTLGIRQLVVLVTLDSGIYGVTDSISQTQCVVRHDFVGRTTHLHTQLVLRDNSHVLRDFIHSQVHQMIVSLGFLSIVSQ